MKYELLTELYSLHQVEHSMECVGMNVMLAICSLHYNNVIQYYRLSPPRNVVMNNMQTNALFRRFITN